MPEDWELQTADENKECTFSSFHRSARVESAHLSRRILQDQRVQGDGAEHARLPRAGLGLNNQIWKTSRWAM